MSYRYLFLRIGARFIRSRYAVFFVPFAMMWNLVLRTRHFLYDAKILARYKVSVPVISVGNIAIGGTGKTPLVIHLAKALGNRTLAILLRGYGKDEELVLRRHLPHAMIYANPDRVKSAQAAIQNGAELILLDDGFQHRRLARDLDVVIARRNDLQGRLFPAGDLREAPYRLKKADVVVWEDEIKIHVQRILTLDGLQIKSIEGEKVAMFCGIGSPEKFKKTILALGAVIEAEWILADHEPVNASSLNIFYNKCKKLGVKYLVCTEKDAVKLGNTQLPILFLEIGIEVARFEKLMAKIEERLYNCCHYGR